MLDAAPITAVVTTTDLERARGFYEGRLGLEQADMAMPEGGAVMYRGGRGTTLLVYRRATAGDSEATCANFSVGDVEAAVEELRRRGVVFEDYDLPEIKTENGIATMGEFKSAWFKDPDGNILAISS